MQEKYSKTVQTGSRLLWVDTARGLAMLCVILGHMGLNNLNILIYSFHMPLFFLIAGHFQKKENHIIFIKKKAKTLLVPYLFTGAVLIFFTQLNNTAKIILHRDDAQSAKYLLAEWLKAVCLGSGARKDFIFVRSDIAVGAIWFLLALFFAQVLVNLLINKKYGIISLTIIAFIGIISAKFIWLPLSIQAGAAAVIYVAIGQIYQKRGGSYMTFLAEKLLLFHVLEYGSYI